MKHTFLPIKNIDFEKRFVEYLNEESEIKSMPYRGNAHKEMFEKAIERSLNSGNIMLQNTDGICQCLIANMFVNLKKKSWDLYSYGLTFQYIKKEQRF